jgi:hypothetical protein
VAHGVPAGLGHGELEVGHLVLRERDATYHAGDREPREQEVLGLGREAEMDRLGGQRTPPCASIDLRMRWIASRRRRDTCICEMPSSAAIWDWVRSS